MIKDVKFDHFLAVAACADDVVAGIVFLLQHLVKERYIHPFNFFFSIET